MKGKGESEKSEFRLQSRELFLTYPQVPGGLAKEGVLRQLEGKLKILNYIIKEELHVDGGKHFHVYLRLCKRSDIRSATRLDLDYEGVVCHGNYQAARSCGNVPDYCLKEAEGSSFITNLELDSNGRELTLDVKLVEMLESQGLQETLSYFYENHKEKLCKRYVQYKRALTEINKLIVSRRLKESRYSSEEYVEYPEIDGYISDKSLPTQTLWISGESGLGKTSAVVAKAQAEHPGGVYLLRHLDQLKGFNSEQHKLLIFDDIIYSRRREELISLMDVEQDTAVNVKYDVIIISFYEWLNPKS